MFNRRHLAVFYFLYFFLSLVFFLYLLLLQYYVPWKASYWKCRQPGLGAVLLIWWSTNTEKTSRCHNDTAVFSKGTAEDREKLMAIFAENLLDLLYISHRVQHFARSSQQLPSEADSIINPSSMYRWRNWGLSKILLVISGGSRIMGPTDMGWACALCCFQITCQISPPTGCMYILIIDEVTSVSVDTSLQPSEPSFSPGV